MLDMACALNLLKWLGIKPLGGRTVAGFGTGFRPPPVTLLLRRLHSILHSWQCIESRLMPLNYCRLASPLGFGKQWALRLYQFHAICINKRLIISSIYLNTP